MNWFLGQLRDITCKLRQGEPIGRLVLGDDDDDDDDEDNERYPMVVLHDDLLIPHWKELADAIQ